MVKVRKFPEAMMRALCQLMAMMALTWFLPLFQAPAIAAEPASQIYSSKCVSYDRPHDGLAEFAANSSHWQCHNRGWQSGVEAAWLRFEASEWSRQEQPKYFFSRIARHVSISFSAVDTDGAVRSVTYLEADGEPYANGPVFRLKLPDITQETRFVLVRIDSPHNVPILTEAALSPSANGGDWTQLQVMLLAFVMGMLVLPLLLDASFYWVLRERFVLLHAIMVVSMMTYVLFASGLISVFATLPISTIAVLGPLSWAVGIGCSAIFLAEFLEPHAQSKVMRRITLATGLWTLLVPGFFALQLRATQPIDDAGYFYAFLPVIVVISAALTEAIARRSRSACFVAIAWFPIILASIERLFRGLGLYAAPSTMDQLLYVGTGLEVIVIAVAIGDRFLTLRRQRDEALTEAKMLESLSEHDPLTGLLNRRAIDARFEDLHTEGYETFALIDLDHFKAVNDTAGHQSGDEVLKVVAKTLASEPDALAIRLGGEEFLVLLKGSKAMERAEKLRRAIPLRVAQQVDQLEHLVTASMGLLHVPREAMPTAHFSDIYSRADMLLYEAKRHGRNRNASERMQAFNPPRNQRDARKGDRRKGDRRQRHRAA